MKKLLIVNNDFDTMSLLKNYLERYNYEVKFTGNRTEVLNYVEKFTPDLLIVDILQQAVIRDLQSNSKSAHIPILLMTGYTATSFNNFLPVNDTIEKPFDLDLLRKKIGKLTTTGLLEDIGID